MQHGELFQHGGQGRVELLEILERKHLGRDLPEHGGDTVLLVEKIGAEAGHAGDLVAEVHVARLFKHFYLIFRCDLIEHRLQGVILQGRIVNALEFAVDAQDRRVAGGKMQVRGFFLEHEIEERVNFCHRMSCGQREY